MTVHEVTRRERAEFFRRHFGVSGDELIEERRTCSGYVSLARPRLTIAEAWARLAALEHEAAET